MNIEVGEYVRSLINGQIDKVIEVSDLLEEPNVKYYKFDKFRGFCSTEIDNVKHSKNIIDLIEVGDYVNGHLVVNEIYGEDDNNIYLDIELAPYGFSYIREKDIKTILTHEQYEQNCYKLEG